MLTHSAPNVFRRRAVAHMAAYRDPTESLTFPYRQNTILRVQLSVTRSDGSISTGLHQAAPLPSINVEDSVAVAQREIIEQEIFTLLVQESSTLPTASAKVSERLIVIEAAQSTELKFELVSFCFITYRLAFHSTLLLVLGRRRIFYEPILVSRPNHGI